MYAYRERIAAEVYHSILLAWKVEEDAEWLKWYKKRTNEILGKSRQAKKFKELMAILTRFGSPYVILPSVEEDLDNILRRGEFTKGSTARLKLGKPSGCHANSCRIYDTNPSRYRVATGYALSSDGLWRQHSWVYDTKDRRIIETTEKRKGYFGFIMTDKESREFSEDND